MATKDELRLSMGKVADWNGKPGLVKFTMDGEPQSLMVTPFASDMQVGQMCAFQMAHEGTSHRQPTDCVPLPLNTTADEAADMIKRMNLNPATSDLIDRMNRNAATYERDFTLYIPALTCLRAGRRTTQRARSDSLSSRPTLCPHGRLGCLGFYFS